MKIRYKVILYTRTRKKVLKNYGALPPAANIWNFFGLYVPVCLSLYLAVSLSFWYMRTVYLSIVCLFRACVLNVCYGCLNYLEYLSDVCMCTLCLSVVYLSAVYLYEVSFSSVCLLSE